MRVNFCSPPDSPPASTPEGSRRRGAVRSPPRGWSAGRWATSKSDRWPRAPSSWWVRPRGAGSSAGTDRARRAAGINGDQRAGRGAHRPGGRRARTRTGPVSVAHRGQSREHHGYRRAGHAGKQAPGHGGRPQESERAGNFDHTCAPARQPAQQRLTRGENFTCAELAMTPVKCHSQPTQCAYIGIWRRGAALPLRTPGAARPCRASGRVAQVPQPPCHFALLGERRRPRVVGGVLAGRQAKVAAVACARPLLGRTLCFRPRWRSPPSCRRAHRLAAAIISPRGFSPGRNARAWCRLRRPSDERPTSGRWQIDEGGTRGGSGRRR